MSNPDSSLSVLAYHDLQWCLRRAPRRVLELMKEFAEAGTPVFIAGGFIRSCISGDPINDVDIFVPSRAVGLQLANKLVDGEDKRIHTSENAFTIRGYAHPVQIIHRWTFDNPEACVKSFDFTVARAAFWWDAIGAQEGWRSTCDSRFYPDLAGRRLIYCSPMRVEEAGGSLLRVLKFYQRGYRIPVDSLGAVVSRLVAGVRIEDVTDKGRDRKVDEDQLTKVLTGLLREVDPNVDPEHIAHLPSSSEPETTPGTWSGKTKRPADGY